MRGRLPSEPARCCVLLSPERMKQKKGAPEDPILFPLSSRTSLLLLSWIQLPGSGGGAAQGDNARGKGEEGISYFILLFCSSVRRRFVAAKKRRDLPTNPPISEQSRPRRALLRPLLPSSLPPFLSLLHLDLRRKWTFYETEIMALRQTE